MNELMLFVGLVVLTAAFFSFSHPVLRRIGIFALGLTTFAAGYLATGNVWVGAACVLAWLFLPWVEILLRVRKLRLPLHKQLRQATPPSRDMFPALDELSDDIEASGYEHVADLGWDIDGYRQFLRLCQPGKARGGRPYLRGAKPNRFPFRQRDIARDGRRGLHHVELSGFIQFENSAVCSRAPCGGRCFFCRSGRRARKFSSRARGGGRHLASG